MKVGLEVRLLGNDAAGKLSILTGVISRLDQNAPPNSEGYRDFNSHYIQAALSAVGGSSGSPVVDKFGNAVALQAGSRSNAASNYLLPLDRPLRARECLQNDRPISRDTIQTQWMLKPFDECRRLGLDPAWETCVRQTLRTHSMLVASSVLPQGPADGSIQVGDVLVKVDGKVLTCFVDLDAILDSKVGKNLDLLVQRDGEDVACTVKVEDLHAITLRRFVTLAGGIFHDLSYQVAQRYAIACRGVYVCEAGTIGLGQANSIVDVVDHKPTPDLDTFIEVIKSIPNRSRVVVEYRNISTHQQKEIRTGQVNRHWQRDLRLWVLHKDTSRWDSANLSEPLPIRVPTPIAIHHKDLNWLNHSDNSHVVQSSVEISCTLPVKIDGFPQATTNGFGLVVDARQGLIIASSILVPFGLCDITITVAGSVKLEGSVVFLHPSSNYVVIKYDPALLLSPIPAAILSDKRIQTGLQTTFVGFGRQPVVANTTVTAIVSTSIPNNANNPRYRAVHMEAIDIDSTLTRHFPSGVLVGLDGTVQALWMQYLGARSDGEDQRFNFGIDTSRLKAVIDEICQGSIPNLRFLSIEAQPIQMAQCRIFGVSEAWISEVAVANPSSQELFIVRKVDSSSATNTQHRSQLRPGDVILTIDGQLVSQASDFDLVHNQEDLPMLVVRDGKESTLRVPTVAAEDLETRHALIFCGATLQTPHPAVRQQVSRLPSHIYVSDCQEGSPASQYGLDPTSFVTHVNGAEVTDLESFKQETRKIENDQYFRLRVLDLNLTPKLVTLRLHEEFVSWDIHAKNCAHYLIDQI